MKRILVVCEGNICRSPMAQGCLSAALRGVDVQSAGLGALIGNAADEIAVRLLQERGIDISSHRARQLTRQACVDAELILVMDQDQRQRIDHHYPHVRGRVFKLGEYTGVDISDPYGAPEYAFRQSLAQIDDGLSEWLPRLSRICEARV